jgi:hypothetical protein
VTRARRVPAYTYSTAYAGNGRVAVTVVDGDRHVVTAYTEGELAASLLGSELVRALTAELTRSRSEGIAP